MSDVKIIKLEEIKKMSPGERAKLLDTSEKELAQLTVHLRMGKEKRSHLKARLQKQIAQIKTLNKQAQHAS